MGGRGLNPVSLAPPAEAEIEANTGMARRAGCSQLGQSAPSALMGCNLSNLCWQVGQ